MITGDGGCQERRARGRAGRGQEDRGLHDPDLPVRIQAVRDLSASKGKRFAVIADEAHSSQAGQAAAKLKMTLSAEEQVDLADGGEASIEDLLAAEMSGRVGQECRHHLRGLHSDPEGQDARTVRAAAGPVEAAGKGNLPKAFTPIPCARRSRRSSSSMS